MANMQASRPLSPSSFMSVSSCADPPPRVRPSLHINTINLQGVVRDHLEPALPDSPISQWHRTEDELSLKPPSNDNISDHTSKPEESSPPCGEAIEMLPISPPSPVVTQPCPRQPMPTFLGALSTVSVIETKGCSTGILMRPDFSAGIFILKHVDINGITSDHLHAVVLRRAHHTRSGREGRVEGWKAVPRRGFREAPPEQRASAAGPLAQGVSMRLRASRRPVASNALR
ncbi:hypothetical protein DICSQDRAFT_175672 [Dichomitus squalens LYAD-421 SS1]|uniref:Uncharacterized protein n=1 Tax=Dichomitus squalens (strain LYAD-421) TaxID=732165 RepID=R7SIG5_DICSQ|nr:uncharacterized protein DICSQDRAFT_175672 [Dichomitus squalens LYAD-421 SS1]EJF55643.1 hypothetical protein DICSQDRAFT_175672 [Dichomitus squalens LYAD-421 SS1]